MRKLSFYYQKDWSLDHYDVKRFNSKGEVIYNGGTVVEADSRLKKSSKGKFETWLDKSDPAVSFVIPSAGEIISNLTSAEMGDAATAVSKIQKDKNAFINKNGFYQEYPKGSKLKIQPFKNWEIGSTI